jgi:hypothetical protein
MSTLSETELESLAAQVDEQLQALYADTSQSFADIKGAKGQKLPKAPKQQEQIAQAAGEPFASFWEKFLRHARQDLCLPGGLMHEQWKKWQDVDSKTAVKSIHGILIGMGIHAHSIPLMLVPVAVFLLNVLLKVGIDAVCEDCEKPS